ncbi:cytochrome c, putative [Plasmodium knowlesi strain H]|uniref:Cytochrome c, putative n=3 Tax=Plasmodium knowlesi TaxID=5850 RepID=A0A5K1UAZ0_PLAKH|nr:cytochrome c, putative [Plasmodium knowlesi strain H]OTN64061.1 putative Cytochrome c [Plasmodium knowlesi]CAA9990723.1 cytochrome c, putative [Plasmodium knowlesi strain H]SBO21210.1 cytochrome c, putative [Plasmodium knowlesi strain H]SBO21663.1 cytochrome c, putative [Plasmodium knowlesi strain H]VVS80197.1 cytochrome c, putative [Plasmodium knowlesi strain H]|eukprot:XP_002262013.1 cytochrome c, putative [Plasmodium knowlesi strain H]
MNLARNKKNNLIDDELPNDFVLPEGDKVKGEKLFKKHCKQCHSIAPDNTQSNSGFTSWGPSLFNVYNRTAGMSKGNSPFQVSPDMHTSGIIWNDLNLMKYMKNPKDFVEANIGMNFKGISNFQDRVDIVHYLRTLTYDDPHGKEIVEKFSKKGK